MPIDGMEKKVCAFGVRSGRLSLLRRPLSPNLHFPVIGRPGRLADSGATDKENWVLPPLARLPCSLQAFALPKAKLDMGVGTRRIPGTASA